MSNVIFKKEDIVFCTEIKVRILRSCEKVERAPC